MGTLPQERDTQNTPGTARCLGARGGLSWPWLDCRDQPLYYLLRGGTGDFIAEGDSIRSLRNFLYTMSNTQLRKVLGTPKTKSPDPSQEKAQRGGTARGSQHWAWWQKPPATAGNVCAFQAVDGKKREIQGMTKSYCRESEQESEQRNNISKLYPKLRTQQKFHSRLRSSEDRVREILKRDISKLKYVQERMQNVRRSLKACGTQRGSEPRRRGERKWKGTSTSRECGCNFPKAYERHHFIDSRSPVNAKQEISKNIMPKYMVVRQMQAKEREILKRQLGGGGGRAQKRHINNSLAIQPIK